jgi:ketosteroid isomerase-like protein
MNTTTEKSDIEKLLSFYGEALNTSDVSKTVALFTKDGINMPSGAPLSKGQEQLKAAYEGLYKAFQLNVEYFTNEVIENGDYAYVRTSSKGTTLVRTSGVTIPVDNKELFILHKDNGQWKISHYMFNNNKMK